jgi:AraC-like DNA-binding protein
MVEHHVCLSEPPVLTAIGAAFKTQEDPYCVAGRWRLHFYASPVVMHADGTVHEIGSGMVGLWAPNVRLDCRFTARSIHTCAHFQLSAGDPQVVIPQLQDLGKRYAATEQEFLGAVRWAQDSPHRAVARLWDLLWQLTVAPEPASPARHPALERACAYIHAHLNQELAVDTISRAAGCSPNHLLRLFRNDLATSTVAYVRRCRVERATYLLRESDLQIKEIASEVGIGDLHFFNKVMRASTGFAPRALRRQSRPVHR